MTISKAQALRALTFTHKTETYADGKTLINIRATGKCKTWKREPKRFKLPVKYGMRDSFYLESDYPNELNNWTCAVEITDFDASLVTPNVKAGAEELLELIDNPPQWDDSWGDKYNLTDEQRDAWMAHWDAWRAKQTAVRNELSDAMVEAGFDEIRLNEIRNQHLSRDRAILREILNY